MTQRRSRSSRQFYSSLKEMIRVRPGERGPGNQNAIPALPQHSRRGASEPQPLGACLSRVSHGQAWAASARPRPIGHDAHTGGPGGRCSARSESEAGSPQKVGCEIWE